DPPLARLGKGAVPADVEAAPLVALGPRDAANVDWIALEHRDPHSTLGEEISCGEPGGPGPDDGYVGIDGTHASTVVPKESRSPFFFLGRASVMVGTALQKWQKRFLARPLRAFLKSTDA